MDSTTVTHIFRVVLPVVYLFLTSNTLLHGASFLFGSDAGGIQGVIVAQSDATTAQWTADGITGTFAAGPAGALLDDRDPQGLGIDTGSLENITDTATYSDPTKFNIIDGTISLSGRGESLRFSFDRPGILRSLLFDGVKDETLEYFQLQYPNGERTTLFDSQTEYRLSIQGYHLADLNVPHAVQFQLEDDDLTGLNVPFQAGEIFTLTYGEADYGDVPDYHTDPRFPNFPNAVGNGARFQGVVVEAPEPASWLLCSLSLVGLPAWRAAFTSR